MIARVMCAALLLGGCTWSNSLYQARALSREALRAERIGTAGDAQSIWGQVVRKADSAYARSRPGKNRLEAQWLRGRAMARVGDCIQAIPGLEAVADASPDPRWRDPLLLELGRCKDATGDPIATELFEQVMDSRDPLVRREARLRVGRVRVDQGRWSDALALLRTIDSSSARIDRAASFAGLHHVDSALAEVEPLVSARDTTAAWDRFLVALAAENTPAADAFLMRLNTFPGVRDDVKNSWLFAAARGAMVSDTAAAFRRYDAVLTRPPTRVVGEARALAVEWRFSRVRNAQELGLVIDSLRSRETPTELGSNPRLTELRRWADRVAAENAAATPGSPQGDLTIYAIAGIALDSLHALRLANGLFARLERDWPSSPYVVKGMFHRLALEPDSGESLRARIRAQATSPYAAYLRGDAGASYVQLEDSLTRFLQILSMRPIPVRPDRP